MESIKRKIAIFTDSHALYEPTLAILEDIRKKGITEIYSLGDNIGEGPNPSEVLELLEIYNVKSIAGNAEEYVTLGIEPFSSYFYGNRVKSHEWTLDQLRTHQIKQISSFKRFYELTLGNSSIALCHFANDVRSDFLVNSTWSYQNNISSGQAYQQFLYTNCERQRKDYKYIMNSFPYSPSMNGIISSFNEPLFDGKKVICYDALFQGHVHFKLYEEGLDTKFYTLRACGMGQKEETLDDASYVILTEKEKGFDYEEVHIPFDYNQMIHRIKTSSNPNEQIKRFVGLGR